MYPSPTTHNPAPAPTPAPTPAPQPATRIHSLDHLVLTVKSIPASVDWYVQNLGMRHEVFVSGAGGPERHALVFGTAKINLHEVGKEFHPRAQRAQPGSADLCFLTDDRVSRVRRRLIGAGVEMEDLSGSSGGGGGSGAAASGTAGGAGGADDEVDDSNDDDGTVIRTGARGKLRSVYCRDPDGNLIEISNYVE